MLEQRNVLELELAAAKIRHLVLDQLHAIGVGHLGGCMSVCDLLSVLYFDQMRVDVNNPKWENRDRLVMSKGHAGPAVYAALALRGFFPREQLLTLNQPHTNLPSHCDMQRTVGIDMTTGSLGQGISCAMGIALACRADQRDSYVYFVCGDGETQEGQIWEAVMFAGHRKLDNVIGFLDYNRLQIDGTTDEICSLESPRAKYEAFGWHVQQVDGHDVAAIHDAICAAKAEKGRPSMIILNTVKGKGIDEVENQASCHNCNVDDAFYNTATARLKEKIASLEEGLK